jgi:hypothetical protein
LNATNKQCARTGRNEVCYGNLSVSAEAIPAASDFQFAEPGNITKLNQLQSLKLTPLNVDGQTWGIVLMKVQANLPGTVAGQTVTMLAFGDVQITDASKEASAAAAVAATAAAAAQPTAEATKPRVRPTPTLPPLTTFSPMQAFYFRSGVGEPACAVAPPDGILIQSSRGRQKITLMINEVRIRLGSTLFVQTIGSDLVINTVEGSSDVFAFNREETAAAGMRVRVPMDANMIASGAPSPPERYNYAALFEVPSRFLPTRVNVAVPPPPSDGTVTYWKYTSTVVSSDCPGFRANPGGTLMITQDTSNDTIWITERGQHSIITRSGENTFKGAAPSTTYELRFDTPDRAVVRIDVDVTVGRTACKATVELQMVRTEAPPNRQGPASTPGSSSSSPGR